MDAMLRVLRGDGKILFRERFSLWITVIEAAVIIAIYVPLVTFPHPILLSSTGELFPSPFNYSSGSHDDSLHFFVVRSHQPADSVIFLCYSYHDIRFFIRFADYCSLFDCDDIIAYRVLYFYCVGVSCFLFLSSRILW